MSDQLESFPDRFADESMCKGCINLLSEIDTLRTELAAAKAEIERLRAENAAMQDEIDGLVEASAGESL